MKTISMNFRRTIFWLVFTVGLVIFLPNLYPRILENWANVYVNRAWFSLNFLGNPSQHLRDGIPDYWQASIWGSKGRAIHGLDADNPQSGELAAVIERTNTLEAAVFMQSIVVSPTGAITCHIYSRGEIGFIQINLGPKALASKSLPASSTWRLTNLEFVPPPDTSDIILYLGIRAELGKIWFDDVECKSENAPQINLITNGSFEADGEIVDLANWWQTQVVKPNQDEATRQRVKEIVNSESRTVLARTNRLNMFDLLENNFKAVRSRMGNVSLGCVSGDGNPGILLGRKDAIITQAGVAGFERVAEFASWLMPHCPQSYAALADLYSSSVPTEQAARLYTESEMRSRAGSQKGGYAFKAARLNMIWLGDWQTAVQELKVAIENPGWEHGTATHELAELYLGQASAHLGQCEEARSAFLRVLECGTCTELYEQARFDLASLGTCKP